MAQFESRKKDLAAAGASMAFIAAEKRDGMWKPEKFLEKHPISVPFLLDEDRAVTKAYGVHNVFSTDALNIAHPATFVIDRDGKVRYIYRGENQNDRVALDEVLKVIGKISSKGADSDLQ
jgi:peroxiredoxin